MNHCRHNVSADEARACLLLLDHHWSKVRVARVFHRDVEDINRVALNRQRELIMARELREVRA